ncbi:hypothetical protein CJF30_00010726 [Rutstroemia sp. NJR-2017a BBW]|nr:hypothetical protein CJF30_00010726 [Rutstroemia sp. NJR-2017a BBW]
MSPFNSPVHPYAGFRLTYGVEIDAKLINDDLKTLLGAAGIPALNELDRKSFKTKNYKAKRGGAMTRTSTTVLKWHLRRTTMKETPLAWCVASPKSSAKITVSNATALPASMSMSATA